MTPSALQASCFEFLAGRAPIDAAQPVDPNTLFGLGLVQKKDRVKILGNGDIQVSLKVSAHAFSASAKQKIEAAGGSAEVLT